MLGVMFGLSRYVILYCVYVSVPPFKHDELRKRFSDAGRENMRHDQSRYENNVLFLCQTFAVKCTYFNNRRVAKSYLFNI